MSTLGIKTLNLLQPHPPSTPPAPVPAPPPPSPPSSTSPQDDNDWFSIIDPSDSPLDWDPSTDQHGAGIPIILPSSFMGSSEAYHDAMAVVRDLGGSDLFITFICNEKWPAIVNNLKPGQRASDRPDFMARAFQLYLAELFRDLAERHVLGWWVSKIDVIEWQKRGKRRAHLLLHLHDNNKIRTAEDIDSIVSAEISDPLLYSNLYDTITSCMHGPCGTLDPNCACMDNFPRILPTYHFLRQQLSSLSSPRWWSYIYEEWKISR